MSTKATLRWARSGAALAALAASGCEATFRPSEALSLAFDEGELLVRADAPPREIWAYPRVYYGGTYVYLVDGVWYYPTPNGWMIFRREPTELSRERTRIYHDQPRVRSFGGPR